MEEKTSATHLLFQEQHEQQLFGIQLNLFCASDQSYNKLTFLLLTFTSPENYYSSHEDINLFHSGSNEVPLSERTSN